MDIAQISTCSANTKSIFRLDAGETSKPVITIVIGDNKTVKKADFTI